MLFTLATIAVYATFKAIIRAQDKNYQGTPTDDLEKAIKSLYNALINVDEPAQPIKGWDVVEPTEFTIRELKHIASVRHIKGYGRFTKTQLIDAIAA